MDSQRAATPTTHDGRNAERPTDIPKSGFKAVAKRVKTKFKGHHLTLAAAGVAFYAFLASVPALAAAISIAGLVLSPERARELVSDGLEAAPNEVADLLSEQLGSVAEAGGGALSIGLAVSIAVALWAASSGMQHLVEAIGIAYDEPDERGFIAKRGQALLLTIGAIIFALLAVAAIAVLPAVTGALDLPGPARWLISLAVWPVLGVLLALGLSVVYRVGPDRRSAEWRWVTWGAGIAMIVWIVASIGFQIYVSNFGSYDETYGSLAAIVIFLMWLFISSLAILLGAEINAAMERQTAADTTVGDRPMGERDAVVADEVGDQSDRSGWT
jgi:membrane protein